jgi:peroxiredoxin
MGWRHAPLELRIMTKKPTYNQMYLSGGRSAALPAGARAPNFHLRSTPDQWVSLSAFRGQPMVLASYPADWSPVCGDQMGLYNEILPEFQELGAELVGISVDGAWCHAAFARDRKLHFPLLADFEPKGAVARSYGVYCQADGVCERALFVIGADGIIHWSYVSPIGVNPGAAGLMAALQDLQKKKQTAKKEKATK